ncbi:MAG: Stk1 family PASTA domain-containing Ser/Thr kinase [Clostridiales bacterium]
MIGKLFNNRYEIKEKLGSGGTSIVYRGQDILLGRMVTIKILREEYASNDDFVRRFRREAQAVASLSHGNIVSVYDVGYEENMHYIVMEFIEGESLKEYIKRKGALEINEACDIIIQILQGVQYAHEHGIIHRDIKPHNILLGVDGRAKVTDFGIAVGMSDVTMTYNTSSKILGSVHYISPEQVQGQPVTEKSDIYSVGVVFYEMLTGQLPYSGDAPISIAMQHVQGELVQPHQINNQIPMGLSYVVMRAMRKNPETRYESAREMADAVYATLGNNTKPAANRPLPNAVPSQPTAEQPPIYDDVYEDAPTDDDYHSPHRENHHAAKTPPAASEAKKRLNGGRITLLVLMAVLAVAIIWSAGKVITYFGQNAPVEMINVVGKTIDAAQTDLKALGLQASIIEKSSTEIPMDQVISQNVEEGQEISPGRTIELTVSTGEPLIEVPLVMGYTERIGVTTLNNLGLLADIVEEYSKDFPKGEVVKQIPEAGSKIKSGGTVTLVISLGVEATSLVMPNVVGKTLNAAQAMITDSGLFVKDVKYASSYDYGDGYVVDQSIDAGANTVTGEYVTLTVSEGPGPSLKSATFTYMLPYDDNKHHVVVTSKDVYGETEVYNQQVTEGETIYVDISYYNRSLVTVYIDSEPVYTENI